ncbi:MAG: hypothetical protein JST00_34840 [Deltaproteobacteria bacterium]|nr:hypothetical protein [Deltaproteobacteria bacterium]
MRGGLPGMMLALVVGCSAAETAEPGGTSGAPPGPSANGSSPAPSSPPASPSTPAPEGGAGIPADCKGDEGGAVPTEPTALQAWLATRRYECWARESAKHPSAGPHGGDVRTYLNAALDASMKGTGEHPAGAVAVKELYSSGATVTGWAVGVKTQAASDGGKGWYWYEVFGTQPGANTIEGQNEAICTNCHKAGKDFVLVPYPLR